MTAKPVVDFAAGDSGSRSSFLGSTTTLDLVFSNQGAPGDTGYSPYIDFTLPTGNNGLSFQGATFLDNPLTTQVLSNAGGTETVRILLPFGSYQAGQTPADIQATLGVGPAATVGAALGVSATSGFLLGNSPLAGGSPPITQATPNTYTLQPSVLQLLTSYLGPEQEAISGTAGPTVPSQIWKTTAAIAFNQVVANLTLTDPLPNGATATQVTLSDGNGHSWTYSYDPATGTLAAAATNAAGAPPVVAAPTGAGPWIWFDAVNNLIVANFGTVTGQATDSNVTGPSIATQFVLGPWQTLGHGETSATAATADLTVTDTLPFGGTAQNFTLTGPDGSVWVYSVSNGVVSLSSGNAATAPAIGSAAGATGARWVWYDQANGKIVADFGAASAGQVGKIDAYVSGGQAQPVAGFVSQTVASGQSASVTLVDQLAGGAQASGFVLHWNGLDYAYDVAANGTVTARAGNPAGGPAIGTGSGGTGGSAGATIWYDAANSRIIASLGAVSGGTAGQTVSLAATETGGTLLDTANPENVALTYSPGASGAWASASGSVAISAGAPPDAGIADGANSVTAKPFAVQKWVTPESSLIPGHLLDWSVRAEIGSAYDVSHLVVTDTLSDGQTFDAGAAPTLTIHDQGQTYTIAFTGAASGDYTVGPKDASGQTTIVFNVSQAMLDDGLGFGDLNTGGAVPGTADFTLGFKSSIDPVYVGGTQGYIDPVIEQGDAIGNQVTASGVLPNGWAVSDGSSAGVGLPTGSASKAIVDVNGTAPKLDSAGYAHLQTGESVTYELKATLPIGNASDVTLADYLPQPVLNALESNGVSASSFSFTGATSGVPQAGQIQWGGADTFHTLFPGAAPTVTTIGNLNELLLDFGDIHQAAYKPVTIDVLFTATVTDAAFADSLLLTNELTESERNSLGALSQSSAITRFVMDSPALKISKGVVATTDAFAQFQGSKGGIAWNGINAATAFSGKVTSAELAATPLNSSVTNVGAGETVEYAVIVQNLGHDTQGAADITLNDTAIPAGLSLVAGSIRVTDGAGHALGYQSLGSGATAGLFGAGIELTDASGANTNVLSTYDANSGGNVAVITFKLATASTIATPATVLPDTVTLTGFADQQGGVNRIAANPAANDTATASVQTATPVVSKSFVSASAGDAANALKIGEIATFTVTYTLPGGTANNVVLSDVLGSGLTLVGAKILSIGQDISYANSGTIGAGSVSANGSFALGNVSVASDTRGAADQIVLQVQEVAAGSTASNVAGAVRTNTGKITETNPATGASKSYSASQSVTLAAPSLTLVKQVEDLTTRGSYGTSITANAGDTLQYDIRLTNAAGAATAYSVTLQDLLNQFGLDAQGNPNVTLVAGSAVVTGGGGTTLAAPAGGGVGATVATLAAGQTVDLSFRAALSGHALYGATLGNTARYTADTLPTTDAGYAWHRTLSGSATASATLPTPSAVKTFIAGSDPRVPLPGLQVGETGTFTIDVTLPAGDSTDLKIEDLLPKSGATALFSYVAGSAQIVGIDAGITAGIGLGAVATSLDAANNGVVVDLGPVHATAAGEHITLRLGAVLNNVAQNTAGSSWTNVATVTSAGATAQTASASGTVVAPRLTIGKSTTFTTGAAGSVATYTVVVKDAAGATNPAYNVTIADPLSPGLVLVSGSERVTEGGVTVTGAVVTENGGGFTVTVPHLYSTDAPITLTYQAKLADSVVDGATLRNTATLSYASAASNGATYSGGSASATVGAHLTDSFSKVLVAASSGASVQSGLVAPGETLTYDLVATLGQGTQHLVLSDLLPTGLDYLSSSVVSLGNTSGSALGVGASGTDSNGVVSFDFGSAGLTNPGSSTSAPGNQVVVAVTAQVDNADKINQVLTNTGKLVATVPTNTYGVTAGTPMQTLTSASAVTVAPATITGRVFVDGLCDGVYRIGDAALAGVSVMLLSANGTPTGQTTTTDSQGAYTFANIPGGSYAVKFVTPQGMAFTDRNVGTDPTLNSAANPTTGITSVFAVAAGATYRGANAGVELTGNFPGVTATQIGSGQGYSANNGGASIVGTGNDNVHTNGGPSNFVHIEGGNNIVETSPGNDVVYSCGSANAQALGTTDYIYAGGAGSTLQGGSGSDFLVASGTGARIAGGAGHNVIIGANAGGSMTLSGGQITNVSIGDDIFPGPGATDVIYQKGDGVQMLETFDPTRGDTLTIYGYSGFSALGSWNGHQVLYLAPNEGFVLNGGFHVNTLSGAIAGVKFVATVPTTPITTLDYGANGLPEQYATPSLPSTGASLPTLASINSTGTLTGTAAAERLIAGHGASFTLNGGAGGHDVYVASVGTDTIQLSGMGNTVFLGSGHDIVSGGTGGNTLLFTQAPNAAADISTFHATGSAHDVLDVSALLATTGWDHVSAHAGAYLQVSASGSDTLLDFRGSGTTGGALTHLADLRGVSGQSFNSLLTNGDIKLA